MIRAIILFLMTLCSTLSYGQFSVSGATNNIAIPVRIYPGEEKAILAGGGLQGTSKDYFAFGDLGIDASYNLYFVYRSGSDHNQTASTSSIEMIKSTDDGETWVQMPQIINYTSINLTDPAIGITPTGRIVVHYLKDNGTVRTQYLKYSDDGGTTWSSEIRFTMDYDTKHINGPGAQITHTDGYLYKPMFATNSPGITKREGPIYKSTDDGLTWTRIGYMYPASNDDFEEPCIASLASGRMIGLWRSDPLKKTYFGYSDDNGVTWTTPADKGLISIGKNPIAVSPKQSIASIGRLYAPTSPTTLHYSTNGGTTFNDGLIDARDTRYIYGGIVWSGRANCFITVYTVESYSSVSNAGPTVLIKKKLYESGTVIAPPVTYLPEYQQNLDYAQAFGATIHTNGAAIAALNSQLIRYLKEDGIWSKLTMLKIFEQNNGSVQEFSLYDMVLPWFYKGTAFNSPTYGVDGFDFNGSTQYVNTGWAPNQGGAIYQQNDACFFIWLDENEQGNVAHGASNANQTTANRGPFVFPRNSSDQIVYNINDDTPSTINGITDSRGLNFLQRRGSTDKRFWKNGVQIDANSAASVGRTGVQVCVGALNFNNGPFRWSTNKVSIVGAGASLTGLETQLYNRLLWYKTQRALL